VSTGSALCVCDRDVAKHLMCHTARKIAHALCDAGNASLTTPAAAPSLLHHCCCCYMQVWAAEGLLYYLEPDSVAPMLKVGVREGQACWLRGLLGALRGLLCVGVVTTSGAHTLFSCQTMLTLLAKNVSLAAASGCCATCTCCVLLLYCWRLCVVQCAGGCTYVTSWQLHHCQLHDR
jgi:hypothetical protein